MPYSLTENGFSQWDDTSCKSKFSGIKTPLWEKSRNKICIEWLRHESHESLPSPAVEKCIVDDGDFWFLIHGKKNIEKREENNRIYFMIKAIIFDFDWVIADTYDLSYSLSLEADPSITKKDFEDHHNGNVWSEPKIRFTQDSAETFFRNQKNLLQAENLFPIGNLLEEISKEYQVFIVSSGREENIKHLLSFSDFTKYFTSILWLETHKSKVEKFKMIFDEYKINSFECLFITDTIGDIKEWNHLWIKTIAVTWGYHKKNLLLSEGPYKVVDTIDELREVIRTTQNESSK